METASKKLCDRNMSRDLDLVRYLEIGASDIREFIADLELLTHFDKSIIVNNLNLHSSEIIKAKEDDFHVGRLLGEHLELMEACRQYSGKKHFGRCMLTNAIQLLVELADVLCMTLVSLSIDMSLTDWSSVGDRSFGLLKRYNPGSYRDNWLAELSHKHPDIIELLALPITRSIVTFGLSELKDIHDLITTTLWLHDLKYRCVSKTPHGWFKRKLLDLEPFTIKDVRSFLVHYKPLVVGTDGEIAYAKLTSKLVDSVHVYTE